jgi:transcriptional regulator with XRE-family HTH domain
VHPTQGELAELAGVSTSAISQAERGRRGLALDTLLHLTSRLKMTIESCCAVRSRSAIGSDGGAAGGTAASGWRNIGEDDALILRILRDDRARPLN